VALMADRSDISEELVRLESHLSQLKTLFRETQSVGRKLEFLLADALAQGTDTLITCGAVQSNHCRLTLAAAVKEGLGSNPEAPAAE